MVVPPGEPHEGNELSARIGLRSTGLVVFGARIASAVTGLVFTVMVARWLVPAQFGLWEFIVTLVSFATYPAGIVGFWATRDVARGRMVGRTALVAGTLLSGVGLAMYFAFTALTYSDVANAILPFLLGAVLVPVSYWSAAAGSVIFGYRPVAAGYIILFGEFAKLTVAYLGLFVYRLGIQGVLAALIASYFAQSLAGTYYVRGAIREKLNFEDVRRWFRLAMLPALSSLPGILLLSDTFFVSIAFGTTVVGFYQAAFLVASVVGYSGALTFSLYPLLLRGGGEKLTGVTLEFLLLFSLPMAAGGAVLARPILQLFGTNYTTGSEGLSILSVMFVFLTISGVLDQTLMGTEKADEKAGRSFRSLVGSNLVFVPVVNVASAVSYVTGMMVALKLGFLHGLPFQSLVAVWALVQLTTTIIFLAVKVARAGGVARLMPGVSVAYYVLSAGAMALVVYFVSRRLPATGTDALVYGAELLAVVGLGAVLYFVLVYALDGKFRQLARTFLNRGRPSS